jgi:Alpha-acetolactate decarboxylase
MLGYSRAVIPVSELLRHGNVGLGAFTDVDGEMIVLDGICYRAMENGDIARDRTGSGRSVFRCVFHGR